MTGQDVYNKLEGNVKMSYDKFRDKMPEMHIVDYYDLRKLDQSGNFKPSEIDKLL